MALDGCTEVVLDGLRWFACRLLKMVYEKMRITYLPVFEK